MPEKAKTKKRIRPVIEEIVEEAPVRREVPDSPPEIHHHHVHEEPSQVEVAQDTPSPEVENRAKALITELEEKRDSAKVNIKLIFALTIVTALIVGFITGGVYVYFTGLKTLASPTPIATSTPKPEDETMEMPKVSSTPTPTPVPASVISAFKVSVLNGSGQAGGAGKVKGLLENAGFKVGNTGNATSFNFVSTQVQVTENVSPEVVNLIKKTLSGDYSVEVGKTLPATSKYDIVVTVGSK